MVHHSEAKMDLWYTVSFILLVTGGSITCSHVCSNGLKFDGYTDPAGDIVKKYGEALDIYCVLDNDVATKVGPNASSYLVYKRNKDLIPQEMIEIVNSTTVKLHIARPPKVTNDQYYCFRKGPANEEWSTVCFNQVTVGIEPQPVTDFDCIGHNHDNLTCFWTPAENYVNTNYTLTYTFKSRASRQTYSCPGIKIPNPNDVDQRYSCFWNISTTPSYRQVHKEYYFNLTMTNKFGQRSITKEFHHFAHVLSGPAENLTALNTTESSILLSWMIPHSMQTFPPGVHHRILYQCEYYEKQWQFGGFITDQLRSEHPVLFNLTNLKYAHSICDIRVALRSAAALPDDESFWSRNTSITVLTSSKIPDRPPDTNVGSFEIVASGNSLEYREAFIYWRQIGEQERNGPDFRYVITMQGGRQLRPVNVTSAYARFQNLSISESYTFDIRSQNANGTSRQKSVVHIPKQTQTDRVPEPASFNKVEFGGGVYELTWEPPKVTPQPITNYTIFWCSNDRDRPYQCNGKMNWRVVASDKRVHNETMVDNKIFQFAISANTARGSSGMLWAVCTVIHNQNVGKMKNVWSSSVGSNYIEISWKLDCSDRIGSVEGFIVYYCPIISPNNSICKGGSHHNVTFKGNGIDSTKANVTGLTPYTTYMLTMSVKTKHSYSQQSEPLFVTTLEKAPSTPPMNFTVVNITTSSISLAWDAPVEMNGKLKYYSIEFNDQTVKIDEMYFYTLDNLESYTNYSIKITACTVMCSSPSESLLVRTNMNYPGKIRQPSVSFQNDSFITILWDRPAQPRGRVDFYEVQMKHKHNSENVTIPIFNSTERSYNIMNCGDDGSYNTFYISVRAVNVKNNELLKGNWSEELESYCRYNGSYLIYLLLILAVLFLCGMGYLFIKLYKQCKVMRNVEVKLPPGLSQVVPEDLLPFEKIPKDRLAHHHPPASADEEHLLTETKRPSRESSGCSSGQESVTSSLDSAGSRNSTAADSGTEQSIGGGGGGSSYCVLGTVAKAAEPSYVPVAAAPDNGRSSYVSCGMARSAPVAAPAASSPYVLTGDVPGKSVNPGYVPFNQDGALGTTSGYVVAGTKNCSGYIPFNQQTEPTKNTGYVVAGCKNFKVD